METKLKREIGVFGGVSLLTGIMVASGIFFIGAHVLWRTEFSASLALLAWLLGGLITLSYGLIYAELGTAMPEAGGYYVYLRRAYGKPVAFMGGFTNFMLLSSGSIAALAIAFAQILNALFSAAFEMPLTHGVQMLIGGVMIVGLSLLNVLGVNISAGLQKALLLVKAIPLLTILILGLAIGTAGIDWSLPANVGFFSVLTMIGFAVIATFWAFEGWTNLNTVAGEVKDPKKTLPVSLIITVLSVTTLYVLFNAAIINTLSVAAIRDMVVVPAGETPNYFIGIPAAAVLLPSIGMYLAMITMLIAVFGALHGAILAFARVYYAMAKDGVFIDRFQAVHPKHKTPIYALAGQAVMALVLLVFDLHDLITLVAFGALALNSLVLFSVFIFRKREPELPRPYKVWGYPVLPAVAIGVTLLLLVAVFVESPRNAIIGTVVIALGVPVYHLINIIKNKQGA